MGETILRKALEDYKTVYMAYRNFSDRTRVEYLNDLQDLVEYLAKQQITKVGELKLAHFERYLAELENRGFTGATRKRKTVTIRSFLKFLYQDGYVQTNIANNIIPPFVDYKTPKFLTKAEVDRLRKACAGNVRDAAIIELLLQTGIRLSELTRLTVDDIELWDSGGTVRIKANRGNKERLLPLTTEAPQMLNAYLTKRPTNDNTALFLNRLHEPLGDRGVQKVISKYFRKADIKRASVSSLRHTFGRHHATTGMDIKTIQTVMGYKDTRSTGIYLELAKGIQGFKY